MYNVDVSPSALLQVDSRNLLGETPLMSGAYVQLKDLTAPAGKCCRAHPGGTQLCQVLNDHACKAAVACLNLIDFTHQVGPGFLSCLIPLCPSNCSEPAVAGRGSPAVRPWSVPPLPQQQVHGSACTLAHVHSYGGFCKQWQFLCL